MLFKEKKKRYKNLLIFIIPLTVLLIVFGVLTFISASSLFGQKILEPSATYDIEGYDYHLRSNATDLQKDLFKELNTLIKDGTDDLAIAESVVKNYVADTYTWDNKKGQWDVGGMCYVHSPTQINIYKYQKDTFYNLLTKYQNEYGKDDLLEVTSVEIESSKKASDLYEYEDETYDYYEITCAWEYSDESHFANEIAKKQFFKVIKNKDGRFEIATCYGEEY